MILPKRILLPIFLILCIIRFWLFLMKLLFFLVMELEVHVVNLSKLELMIPWLTRERPTMLCWLKTRVNLWRFFVMKFLNPQPISSMTLLWTKKAFPQWKRFSKQTKFLWQLNSSKNIWMKDVLLSIQDLKILSSKVSFQDQSTLMLVISSLDCGLEKCFLQTPNSSSSLMRERKMR